MKTTGPANERQGQPCVAPTARDRATYDAASKPRERLAIVVSYGDSHGGEEGTEAISKALAELGTATLRLGEIDGAESIAQAVRDSDADSVELCIADAGGVMLLRSLLKELIAVGRRDVSIVVHRVDKQRREA